MEKRNLLRLVAIATKSNKNTPKETMKTNYSRLLMALVSSVFMATTVGLSAQVGMSAYGDCRIKYEVHGLIHIHIVAATSKYLKRVRGLNK